MQGHESMPGMIPQALIEVFRQVERTPNKEFLLRMSMMEIYNEVCSAAQHALSLLPACALVAGCAGPNTQGRELLRPEWACLSGLPLGPWCALHIRRAGRALASVHHTNPSWPATLPQVLNDLLNPSKANLKLREDPRRGFYVEGITEETLVSMEHALSVVQAGDTHRKVSSPMARRGGGCGHGVGLCGRGRTEGLSWERERGVAGATGHSAVSVRGAWAAMQAGARCDAWQAGTNSMLG